MDCIKLWSANNQPQWHIKLDYLGQVPTMKSKYYLLYIGQEKGNEDYKILIHIIQENKEDTQITNSRIDIR